MSTECAVNGWAHHIHRAENVDLTVVGCGHSPGQWLRRARTPRAFEIARAQTQEYGDIGDIEASRIVDETSASQIADDGLRAQHANSTDEVVHEIRRLDSAVVFEIVRQPVENQGQLRVGSRAELLGPIAVAETLGRS